MTRFLVVAILALLGAVPAAAQEAFPSRAITIVNPYPPGGQADLSGRPFAAALAKILKQPVVLTNKSGAAGAVGMQSVAVAKPDGYTLLITVPSLHTLPEVDKLFGRAPTFTRDQFVPIARLNADPLVVAVNGERPWKS
jgi:tripartite-type tricarboxylate transporter receptor subunit TctC